MRCAQSSTGRNWMTSVSVLDECCIGIGLRQAMKESSKTSWNERLLEIAILFVP